MNVGHQRLLALYNFLLTVPDERVDLDTWVDNDKPLNAWNGETCGSAGCGTTACAVGWALTMPEFNAQGFRADPYSRAFDGGSFFRPGLDLPDGTDLTDWAAVEAFFSISERDVERLFMYTLWTVHDDYSSGDIGLKKHQYLDNDIEDQLATLTDKRLALMRMRNYLRDAGAITYDQVVEMKAKELA